MDITTDLPNSLATRAAPHAGAAPSIRGLAYVVAAATDPAAWASFGESVLGLRACPQASGIALRADERAGRIFIEPARHDRYQASGWEMADEADFAAMIARLQRAGTNVSLADQAAAAARGVLGLARFTDPAGNAHELCWGFRSDFRRLALPAEVPGFVMGTLGMGHTVLPAANFDETAAFFRDVLGFGLADFMIHRPAGPTGPAMRIHFLHCANARHHSLALFEGEVPSGCVHIMLEYPAMDEVGRALDRAAAHGAKLTATLGRHVNDGVISFYCQTPGGFSVEIGCGGRLIDWQTHTVFESTSVSLWGHDFSAGFRD